MHYDDLTSLGENSLKRDPENDTWQNFGGLCVYNDMLPLKVGFLSSSYNLEDDIEVVDEAGNLLGYLCGCKSFEEVSINEITDAKYAAYINEVSRDSLDLEIPFKFKYDYFVVILSRLEDYREKYMRSTSVWGSFVHLTEDLTIRDTYKIKPNKITAVPDIVIPTSYHEESCFRSVVQPYAFERFLKLYHLLELLFDWFFVEKIKNLGSDLFGVSDLLRRYRDKTELNHLVNLISSKCADVNTVAVMLNRITLNSQYISIGEKIFYDYGVDYGNSKSSTGLDDRQKYLALMNAGGFTLANASNQSIKGLTVDGFNDTVIKIAAYWIYRVRCCIAHSRIGEYIMMSDDDEEFVVEVAEPLIREILCQVFKV